MIHTAHSKGFIFPGPHIIKHPHYSIVQANVIDVMAQKVGIVVGPETTESESYANVGEYFYAGKINQRVYEPLVRF